MEGCGCSCSAGSTRRTSRGGSERPARGSSAGWSGPGPRCSSSPRGSPAWKTGVAPGCSRPGTWRCRPSRRARRLRGAAGLRERLQLAFVESPLRPYQTPASYQGLLRRLKQAERRAGQGAHPDANGARSAGLRGRLRPEPGERGRALRARGGRDRAARGVRRDPRPRLDDVPGGAPGAARRGPAAGVPRARLRVRPQRRRRRSGDLRHRADGRRRRRRGRLRQPLHALRARGELRPGRAARDRRAQRGHAPERRAAGGERQSADGPVPRTPDAPEGPRVLPARGGGASPRAAPTCASWSAATATCASR